MITAKNYAAQAERGILDYAKLLSEHDQYKEDAKLCRNFTKFIEHAVHFTLPDSGLILNDQYKGIKGQFIRLPYPIITLEYFVPPDNPRHILGGDRIGKRLIVAAEEITKEIQYIRIFLCGFVGSNNSWMLMPMGFFVNCNWDKFPDGEKQIDGNYMRIRGGTFNVLPDAIKSMPAKMVDACTEQTAYEASLVLEFIEALSCTNIEATTFQEANPKNAKRIKQGKLPMYETKVLTLKMTRSESQGSGLGGSHASPRQHLRRGHIRRLPSGNIWVNSCVVGSSGKGIIDKTYQIKSTG